MFAFKRPLKVICISKYLFSTKSSKTPTSCKLVYPPVLDEAVNQQISRELNASYKYLAMATFFANTSISLPGSSRFFQKMSDDERNHATCLLSYHVLRGGKVNFCDTPKPEKASWDNLLDALQDSLAIEQNNASYLYKLCSTAEQEGDNLTQDWLYENLLHPQVKEIQELSMLVCKLQEVGFQGLGLHVMDEYLNKNYRYKGKFPIIEMSKH